MSLRSYGPEATVAAGFAGGTGVLAAAVIVSYIREKMAFDKTLFQNLQLLD